MNRNIPTDILAAIEAKASTGQYPNQESVRRAALAQLNEFDDDVAGLQVSIDNWKAGDQGIPFEEAFDLQDISWHQPIFAGVDRVPSYYSVTVQFSGRP